MKGSKIQSLLGDNQFSSNKKICFILLPIFFLSTIMFADIKAQALKGRITGKIVDSENGDPLIGANVFLKGTMIGAACDLDGNYKIEKIPPGKYSLIISMMGYTKTTITDVRVSAGEVTKINVAVKPEIIETEGVVVTARAVRNTEAALLKNRQKAKAISDAISAETISRTGSNNAAEAMNHVIGASVVDGRYVYVRGLGNRYTSTQLNGAEIPGTNPYKRAASIDLIPANLVDNIVTLKSFTPDKAGNFSGGVVDIETKNFPDKFTMSFSTSSSYNSQTTFNNDYLTSTGGSMDWLGMDDGTRNIPSELQSRYAEIPNDIIAARKDADLAYQLDKYTKLFNSEMTPINGKAPLNQSYSFSIGNQVNLFNRPLGFLASLTYNRNFSFYNDGRYMRWRLTGHDTTKTSLDNEFDLQDTKSVDEVLWGGLLKISYRLNPSNKISLNGIYNQNGESTSRILEGSYPYDIDPDWIFKSSAIQYNERILKSIQLSGEHKTLLGARIEWRTSFSNSIQDEPDLRYFTHYLSDEGVYGIKSNLSPERYFRFMEEERREATLDISIPFKQWAGRSSTFKFGGMYADKSRDFSERLFKYQPVNGIGKIFREVEGNVDLLFAEENLGVVDTTVAPNGNQYYDFGITVSEIDQKSNNYTGDQTISAFYSMLEIPIIANLRFVGGARYETTNMTVISQDTTKDIGKLDTKDILPAVNLTYSFFDNMNIRFAYGRTLARPTFREISTFASFDFKGGTTFLGNPDLKRTLIDNLDLRWECFSNPGEIYAVSAFWKNFHNPIETVLIDENYNVQWKNVDQARVLGLELEIRKNMGVVSRHLNNFLLGGNLSIIHSKVDIDSLELNRKRATMPHDPDTREFQGQSPYILNINLTYQNNWAGIVTSLYYNIFGKRLAAVSLGGTPDVYEKPAGMLNYHFSWKFTNNISFKFSAKNLLNTRQQKTLQYKGTEYIYSEFGKGRSFSVGIKYDL